MGENHGDNTNSSDEAGPWGAHSPRGRGAFWLAVARALPGTWPWSRLALLARRAARRKLTGPVDTEVWGQRLRLFPDRSVSEARFLFLPRAWDRAERKVLGKWISLGFTFVDVGANAGGYSFWTLSRLGASGRVVAVEPNPALARQLRFNVDTNGAGDRMRVVEAAVGAARGKGTLLVSGRNSGESRLARRGAARDASGRNRSVAEVNTGAEAAGASERHQSAADADTGAETGARDAGATAIPVDVLTLADVVREAGLYRIDCLKVDVEGHEADVIKPYLRSSPQALWPRHLIVELPQAHRDDQRPPELEDWLAGRGYRPVLRTRLNGLFTLASGYRGVLS